MIYTALAVGSQRDTGSWMGAYGPASIVAQVRRSRLKNAEPLCGSSILSSPFGERVYG
jgi:hypothetical protein